VDVFLFLPPMRLSGRHVMRTLLAAALSLIAATANTGAAERFLPSDAERDAVADIATALRYVGALAASETELARAKPTKTTQVSPEEPQPTFSVRNTAGWQGKPIRLPIELTGAVNDEEIFVSVKGFPKGARVSSGIDVGDGQWLVVPSRLSETTVTFPKGNTGKFILTVQLLKEHELPASEETSFQLRVKARK
jgi:hypothetical protein